MEAADPPETPEFRRVIIPPHRRSYLKANFNQVTGPVITQLKLNIRYNTRNNAVEFMTTPQTVDPQAMTRAVNFITSINAGFEIPDSLSFLRLDDIYLDEFSVSDVKTLDGDNLSRAIGRIAGKNGQIKYAIENATRTRISLTDSRVHIIGTQNNVRMARRVICELIMGSPANKIYAQLQKFQTWQKSQG